MRTLLLAVLVLTAATARAETVTLSGRVADSRTIVHRKMRAALFYLRLKVEVAKVDSGQALLRGAKVIELRCWQEIEGEGRYLGGHRNIPADGATFSAVLLRDPEGFFEPAGEGAFMLADPATARTFPILTKAPSTLGFVVGGVVGLIVLVGAGVMRYRGREPKDRSWSAPEEESEG